jgi:spoIIIJ-associated protein
VSNHVDESVEGAGESESLETKGADATEEKAAAEADEGDADKGAAEDDDQDDDADAPETKASAKADDDAEAEEFVEDGRADQALDFVVAVLSKMGMDCTVDLMENDENDPPTDVRIEINGNDANRLIGRKGQTLAALQFIANRVINRPSKVRRHVLIDSDGYRARREQALTSMATRLGKQAVDEGKIITFEPMSAQDRRVVHLALAKFPGVVTKSEGKGATRRVQIIPVRE